MKKLFKEKLAIMAVIFIISVSVMSVDLDKPTETWDEITSYSVGLQFWFNIAKGDFSSDSWKISPHPPVARYIFGVVNGASLFAEHGTSMLSMSQEEATQLLQDVNYLPGRYLSIIFAALISVFVFLIGAELFDRKTGLIASIFLILSPAFFGFVRLAIPDSITIFFFVASLFFFILGLKQNKNRYYILSAIGTGLAIASKFNTFSLFFLLPIIYILYKKQDVIKKKNYKETIMRIAMFLIIPIFIFFAVWPRLWSNTSANLSEVFQSQSFVSTTPEFFFGAFEHPIHYYFTYLFVKTPFLILLLIIPTIYILIKKKDNPTITLFLWLLIPIIALSIFGSVKQTGIKNILLVYPALTLIAARGVLFISELNRNHLDKIVVLIISIYLAINLAAVHPYYIDYYNELVGGPNNVYENKLFLFGFWGEGIGEATDYLNENTEGSVQFFIMPRHVIPDTELTDLTPFVPKYLSDTGEAQNMDMANVLPEANYIVENTYFRWYMNSTFNEFIAQDYELIHTVKVADAPLVWIYKLN